MSLQGNLSTMDIMDLLHWMARREKSGTLEIHQDDQDKSLVVIKGEAISSGSNNPAEYLGQFFINFGYMNEDQAQKTFETQKQTKIFLGMVVTMVGLATEEQVREVIRAKIQETTLALISWNVGEFKFHADKLPKEMPSIQVGVSLQDLFYEGSRRCREFGEIRKKIPNNRLILSPTAKGSKIPAEDPIVSLLKKEKSIEEIIYELHATEYSVLKKVHDWMKEGYLEVVGEMITRQATPQSLSSDNLVELAQEKIKDEHWEDALMLLRSAIKSGQQKQVAVKLLAKIERTYQEELVQDYCENARTPVLAVSPRDIGKMALTATEKYLLTRVNGLRSVKAIMNVAPMKGLDILRSVRSFYEQGLIQDR